jgi:hypothetical protein
MTLDVFAASQDVRIENKTHIYQAANTPAIRIENKIHIKQAANTYDISI